MESPGVGDVVTSPLRLQGEANAFEATFTVELERAGATVASTFVTASSGSGTWGTFDVSLPVDLPPGPFTLVAYDPGGASAGEGDPPVVVRYPLVLAG